MSVPQSITILAPSALHLELYRRIIEDRGDCLNITILTLDTYLGRALGHPRTPLITLLYQYAHALDDLDPDNLFYSSRRDFDFLKDCQAFMELVQLFELQDFPSSTKREKDLLEIIRRLEPIELWVKEAKSLPFEDASSLRILNTETTFLSQYWIDRLKEKGAKMIDLKRHKRYYYWSCSNARKEMEACADAIVANNLDASSVMIALADPSQKFVLAQALESRGIPYTFADSTGSRKVGERWKAALVYLMKKDADSLMVLLETILPLSSYPLRRFLHLFGSLDVSVQNMSWRPNTLIDEETFVNLQELEINIMQWRPMLAQMQAWTIDSIDQIGRMIMDQTPDPSADDISAFEGVMNLISAVRDQLHTPEDLELLICALDGLTPSQALSKLSGVLVAGRKQISGLYDNVFYIGADATHFPGSQARSGIFDEAYLEALHFPSLDSRTKAHFDQICSVLEEPESLFLLTPQADYMGKSIENSHELNMWLGMLPKFKPVAEPSSNPRPSFVLQGLSGTALFQQQDGVLQTRPRSLHTFEECPLKNLLQFGLRLRKPAAEKELFRIRGDLIPMLMEKAWTKFHLPFDELNHEQIAAVVADDFSFARELFPNRQEELNALQAETILRASRLFSSLAPIRKEMNLDLVSSEYKVQIEKEFDGIPMNIEGSITASSSHKAVFNLMDRSGEQEGFLPDELPRATLDLSLQPKAANRSAFSLRYGSTSTPARASAISQEEAARKGSEEFFKQSLSAQNFQAGSSALEDTLIKKVPTYEKKESRMSEQAGQLASSLARSDFKPLHKPDACAHCNYRAICRNAAIEKG